MAGRKTLELANGKCQLVWGVAKGSAVAEREEELRVNRSLNARLWRWGLVGEAKNNRGSIFMP